jgi:arylsulfatase
MSPRELLQVYRRLAFILIALFALGAASFGAQRPNILLIMSDDMGFSDLGCYGGEIHTPNLDRLAHNGLRFSQFYNNARCCPTRASLLTGLYPHQAGVGHMTGDGGRDGYRGQLNQNCVTIAEVLRPAGYQTYMCGKWHVCRDIRPDGDKSDWPVQRGFDDFYGTITGGGSFYDPTTLCRQNRLITPENDAEYHPSQFYYTDAITDNTVQFLKKHDREHHRDPFFFYVAYTAAHWPMHALEKDIAKYRGKFNSGYEPIRRARWERAKQLGLISGDLKLSPEAGDWQTVSNKAWEARCMEVYAAMVDCMDQGIGRIVEQLRQSKQLDNTLILFLQDNGGCAEPMGRTERTNQPPANLKPFTKDELQTKIWPPMQTRDGRWVRSGEGVMPGPPDTYVAYGRNWANVSNTPFREYKHWVHEGGISTPLIAHWPQGIQKKKRNCIDGDPGHVVDLMATCVELARAAYPKSFGGQTIKPREGVSLLPAFSGKAVLRTEPIFWEHEGNRAVRDGRWKLVAKEKLPWELYDMELDRSELHDLASEQSERASQMAAKWDAWAARADVLPLGAWKEPAPARRMKAK